MSRTFSVDREAALAACSQGRTTDTTRVHPAKQVGASVDVVVIPGIVLWGRRVRDGRIWRAGVLVPGGQIRVSEARDSGEFDRFKFYDHSKPYIAAVYGGIRMGG